MRLRHSQILGVDLAVTPLDQLRLRLPDHDFDRLMQAAKPVADRDALLKDIAAELGQHEVVGPACCIGLSAKCSGAIMSLTSGVPDVGHGRGTAMTGVLGDGQPILRH